MNARKSGKPDLRGPRGQTRRRNVIADSASRVALRPRLALAQARSLGRGTRASLLRPQIQPDLLVDELQRVGLGRSIDGLTTPARTILP